MDILSPQGDGFLDQQQGMVRKIESLLNLSSVARLVQKGQEQGIREILTQLGSRRGYCMVHYKAEDGEMSIARQE